MPRQNQRPSRSVQKNGALRALADELEILAVGDLVCARSQTRARRRMWASNSLSQPKPSPACEPEAGRAGGDVDHLRAQTRRVGRERFVRPGGVFRSYGNWCRMYANVSACIRRCSTATCSSCSGHRHARRGRRGCGGRSARPPRRRASRRRVLRAVGPAAGRCRRRRAGRSVGWKDGRFADQVPVEGFEVAEVKDDAVALGDRPVVDGFGMNQAEQRVGDFAGLRQ